MLKNYHFIGIGGIGMSGLARLVLARSEHVSVSGSDIAANAVTEALIKSGAKIHIGHSAAHIAADMTVIYSTDIKKDNPEFQAALTLKCPLLHRSELLQLLMETHFSLAVAGTHGKTTSSSLLTWVLSHTNQSPTYAIGGIIPQLSSNADSGHGKYFVAEACESDGTFLNYSPNAAIVTNVDLDHMDYYGNETALVQAFSKFMSQVRDPKNLFWCGEDARLCRANMPGISYGFTDNCALKGSNFKQVGWSNFFDVDYNGKHYSQVEVSLIGYHNALNALAVFGLALSLGIPEEQLRDALKQFKGVLRRCEKKGESHGILFLDDYAHHPTELKATLQAIRSAIGERRLIAIYQPHRYSRAKECMGLYSDVFDQIDTLFVTEIYSSREAPIPGVTHAKIIEEISQNKRINCLHVPRNNLAAELQAYLRPHDVVVTLGAGDITKGASEMLRELALKPVKPYKVGVICGGVSVEHEISLLSVAHILDSLQPEYYQVQHFGITRQGTWLTGPDVREKLKSGRALDSSMKISPEVLTALLECDILFPVLHGTNGEDGTIQGFFEVLGKAYVGCDWRSSAMSMDKSVTKKLLLQAGVATSPFVSFSDYEWATNAKKLIASIDEQLSYPVYVKPSHLGSSIGVHRVASKDKLAEAVNDAFRFDTHLIVENEIVGREIEFSVLGNDLLHAFPPGEIFTGGKTYDYDNKYGPNGMKASPTTNLPPDLQSAGMDLVKTAFAAVGCLGMARVDTFLDKHGKFWLNEINPIPGFTSISLYPQMCAVNGLDAHALMDQLIILGLQRRRKLNLLEVVP